MIGLASLAVILCLFLIQAGPALGSSRLPWLEQGQESGAASAAGANYRGPFGFGREATEEEIAAWDIDVRPDGAGLPDGSGTVAAGAELFAEKCVECHGEDGTGGPYASGPFGAGLVGPYDPAAPWPPSPRTIGSFWPYATTVYDYIQRAQPYNAPGSLTPDEVYALVAWLLYQNELIAEDAVIDAESLPQVEMPAHERFIPWDVRDGYPYQ
jgi:cytochrome c